MAFPAFQQLFFYLFKRPIVYFFPVPTCGSMKQVALIVLLLFGSVLYAQDLCRPTSVFFDLNQSELKSRGKNSVDSLLQTMNGSDFILEIYGYTDTSHTDDYNRKLSQNRIDAVLEYLKKKGIAPKEIRTFNEGEDFTSNNLRKDAAFQRRVDLYLTRMEGNNVVFRSPDGVVVKRDLAFFGDCGICALKPKMKYLQSEMEANVNGISLLTDQGERLITYGMALFEIDSCASVPAEQQFKTCMELPAREWNNGIKLYELVEQPGNDVWRRLQDSLYYDSTAQVMRFCTDARKINCDALDVFEPGFRLIIPEKALKGRSVFKYAGQEKVQPFHNDTVNFPRGVQFVISSFREADTCYLFRENAWKIKERFLNRDSVSPQICQVFVSDYRVVAPLRKINLKVKMERVDQVGYYHPDFDLFIPLQRTAPHTYSGYQYQDGFELCLFKGDRFFLEKNKARKLKFKTRKGVATAKLKQTYLFRKNKLRWKKSHRGELK